MQKKMDGGTEKNCAKGLVTALGGMLGEALKLLPRRMEAVIAVGGGHTKY